MKTNNPNGRKLAIAAGVYFIAKAVLNMIMGGSFGDIIYAAIEAAALYMGLQYINYVVAGAAVLVVLLNLKTNLSDISGHLIYLIEAMLDIVCAALLIFHKDIKEHFTNKWSELQDIFSK